MKKFNFYNAAFLLVQLNLSIIGQNSFNKLTILTAPIGYNAYQSGGPSSVTKSLLRGLKKLGVNFNHNPRSIEEVGDCVYALSDVNTVYQGIDLKRRGIINKLVAGPNIMTRSNECNRVLASPEIDTYIVNSEWTYIAYIEDESSLKGRLQIWPAGVDADYWKPEKSLRQKITKGTKKILVYWKTESEQFCSMVEKTIRSAGFKPVRIQYGHYNKEHFKNALQGAVCAVFISRSESQGIALAESWAMDVPTLVWDLQEPATMCGKAFWPVSAAPYLSKYNGVFWKNNQELQLLLSDLYKNIDLACPREWTLRHMTDEICAQYLLDIINTAPRELIPLAFD